MMNVVLLVGIRVIDQLDVQRNTARDLNIYLARNNFSVFPSILPRAAV